MKGFSWQIDYQKNPMHAIGIPWNQYFAFVCILFMAATTILSILSFPAFLRQRMMHTGLTYGMGTAATSTNLLFHCKSSQCETFYRDF